MRSTGATQQDLLSQKTKTRQTNRNKAVKEMAQQLRTLAAFPKDPGLVPAFTRPLTTVLNSSFRVRAHFWTQTDTRHTHGTRHMQAKHPHIK